MAYTKTTWVDKVTPLSAQNMNKIENGIAELFTNIIPFIAGTTLTSGYDLNNAETQGFYCSNSSAVTTSLVNKPSTIAAGSFLMLVAILGSNVIQIIFMPEAMYIRRKISTGWAAWRSVALS